MSGKVEGELGKIAGVDAKGNVWPIEWAIEELATVFYNECSIDRLVAEWTRDGVAHQSANSTGDLFRGAGRRGGRAGRRGDL